MLSSRTFLKGSIRIDRGKDRQVNGEKKRPCHGHLLDPARTHHFHLVCDVSFWRTEVPGPCFVTRRMRHNSHSPGRDFAPSGESEKNRFFCKTFRTALSPRCRRQEGCAYSGRHAAIRYPPRTTGFCFNRISLDLVSHAGHSAAEMEGRGVLCLPVCVRILHRFQSSAQEPASERLPRILRNCVSLLCDE